MSELVPREDIWGVLEDYDPENLTLASIGSHSCLDVCDGAADEGLRSLALCQQGRDSLYTRYFKRLDDAQGNTRRGFVDDAWVFPRFDEVLTPKVQERLRNENTIMVPNRSFTSYCDINEIEQNWKVPMLGTRSILSVEERGDQQDYYWLLEKAGLPFPEKVSADEIDDVGLCIVKLHHAEKALERGFFTASTHAEYEEKAQALLDQGVINEEGLEGARIERYVIGPVFNFDLFYSPLAPRDEAVELLGVDWRFESSLDGHVRLPAPQQMALPPHQMIPEMTVVGHNSATLRESLLGKVFEMAETFVEASKEHFDPGIIGPFCLQTCVDKDMNFYIYDVAPRIGGGTNVHVATGHPYGNALYRKPVSTGRRCAMEVKDAVEQGRLKEIVT